MTETQSTRRDDGPPARGVAAAWWGLGGVVSLFLWAVYRLGLRGVTTIRGGLSPLEWAALAVVTVVFFYGEGVLGLDRRWTPRLMERVSRLRGERGLLAVAFAPAYALALVGGTRRDRVRARLTTTAIVIAVVAVRRFPEPWRGIVDFAVATALAWALIAIARRAPAALE